MDRKTGTLTPPNEHPHYVLPGENHPVSHRASSHHSIVSVYRDGIGFIDQAGAMQGFLSLIGVWGSIVPLAIVLTYDYSRGVPWVVVASALLVLACLMMVRADNVKYHYYPVLFDRAARKVHLFVEVKTPWWKIWQLTPPSRVESWDWAQARAEIVEFLVVTNSAVRSEYGLVCAITERPGANQVIARFGVGLTSSYDGGQAMVERWEHIRRFMTEDGPHLAPGDAIFLDESTTKLWNALTWGQPLLGSSRKAFWSGSFLKGWWFLTIPAGALMLVFLPFTIVSGLLRMFLHRIRCAPVWPADVLSSVGPEMSISELSAK